MDVDLITLPSHGDSHPARTALSQPVRKIPRPYLRPSAKPLKRAEKITAGAQAPISPVITEALASARANDPQPDDPQPDDPQPDDPQPDHYQPKEHQKEASLQNLPAQYEAKQGAGEEEASLPLTEGNGASTGGGAGGQVKSFSPAHSPEGIQASPAYPGLSNGNVADKGMAYDSYKRIIRQQIERHKLFPPLAVRRGWEGRVGIRFILHSHGHADQIEVSKSSAIALLDDAAVSAVKAGNPFPPFPEGISHDSVMIEVTLNFELQREVEIPNRQGNRRTPL